MAQQMTILDFLQPLLEIEQLWGLIMIMLQVDQPIFMNGTAVRGWKLSSRHLMEQQTIFLDIPYLSLEIVPL